MNSAGRRVSPLDVDRMRSKRARYLRRLEARRAGRWHRSERSASVNVNRERVPTCVPKPSGRDGIECGDRGETKRRRITGRLTAKATVSNTANTAERSVAYCAPISRTVSNPAIRSRSRPKASATHAVVDRRNSVRNEHIGQELRRSKLVSALVKRRSSSDADTAHRTAAEADNRCVRRSRLDLSKLGGPSGKKPSAEIGVPLGPALTKQRCPSPADEHLRFTRSNGT